MAKKGSSAHESPEATQHTRMAPTLKEWWDLLEQRFHEYDRSRANKRWQALNPRVVKGQVPSSTWRISMLMGNICCL